MAADAVAPCVPMSSASMILNMWMDIIVYQENKFQQAVALTLKVGDRVISV